MRPIRTLVAAGLLLGSLHASAANFSDLWWNPQESGTGLQIVQQGETAFVTLFTYSGNNEPFWLVASDARPYAYTDKGLPAFRGALYRTRGTAFSDTYNPGNNQVTEVGQIYITPSGDNNIEVEYTVNNITVKKALVRQTFSMPIAGIHYAGQFVLRQSQQQGGGPYGTRDYAADILLHLNDEGQGVLRVTDSIQGLCDYRGPYKQEGRYGAFAGSYTCESGATGTFEVSRLEYTDQGVTAQFNTTGPDGFGRGRFGAVAR